MPRALQRFCTARLVSRVAGMHLNSTLGTQVMWRDGPMAEGEISPRARPGLSPLVMGIVVSRLCAGMPINRIFQAFGMPMGPSAKLGYGIGNRAGGVLQRSGKDRKGTSLNCSH